VVEEGKRWSRLVGVLGGKRTEHTIKNRFNAMIAKNRRYKFEKDIKVALRILEQLRTGMQGEPKKHMESRFKEENISYEDSFEEKEERKHYKVEEKSEQAEVEFPLTIKMEVSPQQ
jgi:predicted metal-dependent HD superfamily phosphohydrolase